MPKSVLDATIQAFSDTYTWPTAEQRVGGIDASLSTSVIGALARDTYFSDLAKPEQYRYRMMTTPDPEDDRFPARTSYDIKPHVAEINRALATMLAHLPLQTELALESANHGE